MSRRKHLIRAGIGTDYAAIDSLVRERVGTDFDYWRIDHRDGGTVIEVRMKPRLETINLTISPASYPDAIENPVDPPTVDGTSITRPFS